MKKTFKDYCVYDTDKFKAVVANDNSFHMVMDKQSGLTVKFGAVQYDIENIPPGKFLPGGTVHTRCILYAQFEDIIFSVKQEEDGLNAYVLKHSGEPWEILEGKAVVEDDPEWCPYGPELLDIEVTTKCGGIRDKEGKFAPCPFCYKANTAEGDNMSLETFKVILDKVSESRTLNQVAFGADATLISNPDLFSMFQYCRDKGIVPNVTCADLAEKEAEQVVKLCGAVAVSWYPLRNKERCYDTVALLTKKAEEAGRKMQINIHALLSKQTLPLFDELIEDIKTDIRLKGLNAVVVLSLKQKGRGTNFDIVSQDEFETLMDTFQKEAINYGMDSCSASKFLEYLKKKPSNIKDSLSPMIESCESFMWSSYINTEGRFFPCSFMEGEGEWKEGIDVTKVDSFVNDIWKSCKGDKWRNTMSKCISCKGHTECPYYKV